MDLYLSILKYYYYYYYYYYLFIYLFIYSFIYLLIYLFPYYCDYFYFDPPGNSDRGCEPLGWELEARRWELGSIFT